MAVDERKNFRLQKESFRILPVIDSLIQQFKLKADKTVTFSIDAEPKEIQAHADKRHFTNAISNLLDNAIKYSGPTVGISIRVRETAGLLEVCITDNGFGISPVHQSRIFERFYRISKGNIHDVKGFGLGLRELYQKQKPDIMVLDVMMPQMDGFTLAKMIRQIDTRTPILFLSARSSVDDLVTGFYLGGNDYLKKPFDMEELIVRIQALLNRPISISEPKNQEVFTIGQYTFHYPHQTLQISDQTNTLSHREVEILRLLCLHANDVLHRKPVLMELWGNDSFFNARSMDVFINKMRLFAISLFNKYLINRKSRIGNDLKTSVTLWFA